MSLFTSQGRRQCGIELLNRTCQHGGGLRLPIAGCIRGNKPLRNLDNERSANLHRPQRVPRRNPYVVQRSMIVDPSDSQAPVKPLNGAAALAAATYDCSRCLDNAPRLPSALRRCWPIHSRDTNVRRPCTFAWSSVPANPGHAKTIDVDGRTYTPSHQESALCKKGDNSCPAAHHQ